MMAACSETDNISVQNTAQQAETAVSFDTYTAKALTRAGAVGEIVTKEDLQVNNFGVFAYYSNGTVYTKGTSKPDFMWNQKVEYDGDNWFYFPVKYWPNETAAQHTGVDIADPTKNGATAEGAASPDVVSFFAYAPYVEASTSGDVTPNGDGITKIVTLNTTQDDPKLNYTTPSDPLKTVDLLWGVVPAFKTKYSTVLGEQDMTDGLGAGFPNYNLYKQTTDERIMFQFKHALAKLTIDVKGFFDDVPEHGAHSTTDPGNAGDASDQSANNVAKDTKIVVEYVKLSTEKYSMASQLNLNNTTANDPLWDQDATNAADPVSFTISGSQLANLIRYRTPSTAARGYAEQPRGVTKDAVALLANDASQEAFYGIIPKIVAGKADANWTVEVKYHVFTKDANLENGYSEITNVIKKDNITMTFEHGKHYTLQLRLGMTTVKFDATVEDWVDGGSTPADLPINVAVKSLSGLQLQTAAHTPKNADDTYTGYSAHGPSGSAFTFDNGRTIISVNALKYLLENQTGAPTTLTEFEGVTLESDVDWIAYDAAGNFVAEENRTATNRTANIWAVYGGVKSDPIALTQSGSTLSFELAWDGTAPTPTWNQTGPFGYKLTVKYVNKAANTMWIDVTKDANANGTFNHANWLTVDRANKKVSILSNNENETTARTSTISLSYGGGTSDPISITQQFKGYVAP